MHMQPRHSMRAATTALTIELPMRLRAEYDARHALALVGAENRAGAAR